MAIQEQLDLLQQGTGIWNTWRTQQSGITIDLSFADLIRTYLIRANLSKADLSRADLSFADLSFANLREANLTRADLRGADLRGADLRGADLYRANFSFANLREADLSGAYLIETNLKRANLREANLNFSNLIRVQLRGTDFSETRVRQTIFGSLDFRTAKGLERINHEGPSIIGTDTLERSEGDIPEPFLRGAGLSETFITYARSLTQSPIQYYTCFISYSSKDEQFAKRLHNDLQQEGVRCWFAPEDMNIGDKIRHRIDESIRLYDKLLLILSEHSIKSNWVSYEIEKALNKEPQGIPNVLYPVRVDQTILTCTDSWAKEIQETRHIGNFEHWTDPQQYEDSFKRLLRALNTKKERRKS